MKTKYAAYFLGLALGVLSCRQFIQVGQEQNQEVAITQPNPVASPTPSPSVAPGTCVAAAAVRVGFFSFSCPPGVPVPANNAGVLPVGCTGTATATPKDRDGRDQNPDSYIGIVPEWTVTEGNTYLTIAVQSEPFNVDLRWQANTPPGTKANVKASVCGVDGRFEFVSR